MKKRKRKRQRKIKRLKWATVPIIVTQPTNASTQHDLAILAIRSWVQSLEDDEEIFKFDLNRVNQLRLYGCTDNTRDSLYKLVDIFGLSISPTFSVAVRKNL